MEQTLLSSRGIFIQRCRKPLVQSPSAILQFHLIPKLLPNLSSINHTSVSLPAHWWENRFQSDFRQSIIAFHYLFKHQTINCWTMIASMNSDNNNNHILKSKIKSKTHFSVATNFLFYFWPWCIYESYCSCVKKINYIHASNKMCYELSLGWYLENCRKHHVRLDVDS